MAVVASNGLSYFDRLEQTADFLVLWLQVKAPKASFNLAVNGIRKAYSETTGYPIIVIGGEPAPYAIYTNEPWISPRWGGKQNPNQEWIQNAIIEVIPTIQSIMSGVITKDDLARITGTSEMLLNNQFDSAANQYAI